MTRKDFQLIAAALNRVYLDSIPSHAAFATACHAISLMADALATTNPRFNRERFILACKAS